MSESLKGMSTAWLTGRKQSEETIRKRFANSCGANNPKAREVYQYDLDGHFISRFGCMEEAKEKLGLKNTSHISQCCCGKRGKAYGFMWSYYMETKEAYVRRWKGGIVHG